MPIEYISTYNTIREQKRKRAERINRNISTSISSQLELVDLATIFEIYKQDGKYKMQKVTKKAAPVAGCQFLDSDPIKSINHQYLYKLLNALNALVFNLRFLTLASKINSTITAEDGSLVNVDFDYIKSIKFKTDKLCLLHNSYTTLRSTIKTDHSSFYSNNPTDQFYKDIFSAEIVSTLEDSIKILQYWYKKVLNLQLPISETFESRITKSISTANKYIELISSKKFNFENFRNTINAINLEHSL